ncbi:MAG: ScyD/ScyE family protein, partial [Vicinamibacterales bacterium]
MIALALSGGATTPVQAQSSMLVIASGLDNPRGLNFGPDGALYVAEAGRGGTSELCHVSAELGTRCYGPSGAVTRITGVGVHSRVLTGLASIAPASGNTAQGPNDIQFGFNSAWIVSGFGGNPLDREQFEAAGIRLGSLVRATGIEQYAHVLDISDHEITNPDGGVLDTNPFGMRILGNRILIADAGANALLNIGLFGQISTIAVFPDRTVGPSTIQSVPTTVVEGPDGFLYVGELTGFPFPVGA